MHAMKANGGMKVQFHLFSTPVPAGGDYICEAVYAKTVGSAISLYEKEHRAQLFRVLLQPAHLVGIPIQRSKEILCFPHLCHP
jgi:hypothetical protein